MRAWIMTIYDDVSGGVLDNVGGVRACVMIMIDPVSEDVSDYQ